jgi:hypothetical protein
MKNCHIKIGRVNGALYRDEQHQYENMARSKLGIHHNHIVFPLHKNKCLIMREISQVGNDKNRKIIPNMNVKMKLIHRHRIGWSLLNRRN